MIAEICSQSEAVKLKGTFISKAWRTMFSVCGMSGMSFRNFQFLKKRCRHRGRD